MSYFLKLYKLFILSMFLMLLIPTTVSAKTTLDEIQEYNIIVNVREDGTLDMDYKIRWKVLDSFSEGPLEWVKIGIPNKHIDQITAKTDNIKKIKYYPESGKTFVRIDFDKSYVADEIITFEFSFHQGYMYTMDESNNTTTYSFTPGWFEDIEVKQLLIRWNAEKVLSASTDKKDGEYFIWNSSLEKGEKFQVIVNYDINAYAFHPDAQSTNTSNSDSKWVGILISIIIIVFFVFIIIAIKIGSDYDNHSGFGGGGGTRYRSTYINTNRTRSSCVRSSCACACACACAGGGRAGCSLKDFYGTNLKTASLKKAIKIDEDT